MFPASIPYDESVRPATSCEEPKTRRWSSTGMAVRSATAYCRLETSDASDRVSECQPRPDGERKGAERTKRERVAREVADEEMHARRVLVGWF